jgi:hypothetical protein
MGSLLKGLFGLALLFAASANVAYGQSPIPNQGQTPGAINPAVTQATISTTICVPGWTRTVRPPSDYTSRLKRQQLRAGGGADQRMADFEEDHLIPLSLGGAPADPRNLWPQPRQAVEGWSAERKDALEERLNRLVCAGQVALADAQHAMATNWTSAYTQFIGRAAAPARVASPAPAPRESGGQCPGDVLVWVNTRTGVFHFPGERWYGNTRQGEFICEKAALAEGDRATRNGQ